MNASKRGAPTPATHISSCLPPHQNLCTSAHAGSCLIKPFPLLPQTFSCFSSSSSHTSSFTNASLIILADPDHSHLQDFPTLRVRTTSVIASVLPGKVTWAPWGTFPPCTLAQGWSQELHMGSSWGCCSLPNLWVERYSCCSSVYSFFHDSAWEIFCGLVT